MGRFFTFLMFFVISTQMGTFPSSKVDKAMIELQFYRTRNENNFSQATTFCDQKNSRDRHNEALTNLFKQHLTSCLSEREEKTFLSRQVFPAFHSRDKMLPRKPNVFLSKKNTLLGTAFSRRKAGLCASSSGSADVESALSLRGKRSIDGLFSFFSAAICIW